MPTYNYFCEKHGDIEVNHPMSETIKNCPECKKNGEISTVKLLISKSTSFVLKGNGWAKDNYGK